MQQKNMALGLFCCICFGFGCGKGFLFDAWFVFPCAWLKEGVAIFSIT